MVQSTFAHCYDLWQFAQLPQRANRVIVQFACVVRVYACRGKESPWRGSGQLCSLDAGLYGAACDDKAIHPCGLGPGDDFIPVMSKAVVGEIDSDVDQVHGL